MLGPTFGGLFWELHQSKKIGEAESAAAYGAEKAMDAVAKVRELEDRVDKLTLITMALWSLLRQVSDVTDEDLLERVKDIDLTDGRLDGKVRQPVGKCPQCNRVMSQKHKKCLYCGYEHIRGGPFDGVIT